MRICLTGKGNLNGKQLTRTEWEGRIVAAGHSYTENAAHADVLVASRTDTVKARNARARGARVESYDWLTALVVHGQDRGVSATQTPPPAARTPKPKPIDTTAMEDNPLWGMF